MLHLMCIMCIMCIIYVMYTSRKAFSITTVCENAPLGLQAARYHLRPHVGDLQPGLPELGKSQELRLGLLQSGERGRRRVGAFREWGNAGKQHEATSPYYLIIVPPYLTISHHHNLSSPYYTPYSLLYPPSQYPLPSP
jgi:hypothetical protein